MAKKIPNQATRPVAKRGVGYAKLVKAISQVNTGMVTRAAVAVNQALVLRNWMIGAYIVEFEQNGADRAKYGVRLLPTLAADLKEQGIKGLGAEVLRTSRLFFLSYPEISHTLSGKLELSPELISISQTVCGKSGDGISQPVVDRFALPVGSTPLPESKSSLQPTEPPIRQTPSAELPTPLSPEELLRFSWSQLQELIRIEDPWKRAFYENELLRGHVLIDLKIRAFKPEDAGQMNFYVNWFKAKMMHEGDNPPVGILLCSDKDGTEVEFATAGMDNRLFVSRYLDALPSADQLKAFLERDRERIESLMPPVAARKRTPRKPKL